MELDNFKEIFTSNKDYLSGIGNTLKFTIISNIVKLIPALLIAIMLQEGLKGKGLYRTYCICRPFFHLLLSVLFLSLS
ncbi:MAG: hypothetical protein ACLTZM_10170 [Ruminococcus sp.]